MQLGQLEQVDPAGGVLDGFPDPAWSVDAAGRLTGWNPAAARTFGHAADEVRGRLAAEVLGPLPDAAGPVALRDRRGRPVHGSLVVWSGGGARHAALRPSGEDAGALDRRVLQGLLEHVSDAVVVVDAAGLVLSLNPGAERLYGVGAEEVLGQHAGALVRRVGTAGHLAAVHEALRAGRSWRGVEVELVTRAGREVLLDTAATPLLGPDGAYAGAILVHRDVTPVRELEQSLRAATRALRDRAAQMARATHRDALTGVAARSLLQERLAAALAAAAEEGGPVCVLAADLHGFRAVNDSYGLATGDALLIAFAAHLRAALPPSATAGRLGADEFAVVLPGVDREEAERVAAVVRAWAPPSPLPGRGRRGDDPDVGVTVGFVLATAQECRSPFDTGVRAVLQRAEDAVAAGQRERAAGRG